MIEGFVNQNLPLELALADGRTDRFPQVKIYDDTGSVVATINLDHVADGLYTNQWGAAGPLGHYRAHFIVYSDGARTTVANQYDRELEHIRLVSQITATGIAFEVWEEQLAAHPTLGSAGQTLDVVPGTGLIADAVRDKALTESEIAEAVWEEDVNNHLGGSKAGQKLIDAGAVASVPTTGQIADAVWNELAADHQTGGSMGEYQNRLDQSLSQLETDIRGADGDTLKTLSDQIDGVATPADIPTTGAIATAVRDQALTESEIAEAVWEEELLNHLGSETKAGQALLDADATAVVPTTGDIADAVRDRAVTEGEIAEAVWNQDLNNHLGLPKAGQSLLDADAVAVVPTTGDIADAVRDRALTEAEIAEAVWQEDVNNHQGGTKTGQTLIDAAATGGVVPTTGEIADAVWNELAVEHQTGGTMGERQNRIDQSLSQMETDIRGADGDTLKTLSDQIDSVATPADIPTTGQIATAVRDQALTESEIAEAVWEEELLNHIGPDTKAGQALLDADATAVVPTTGDIASAVRDQALNETKIAEAVWNQDLNNHLGLPKAGQSLLDADAVAVVPTTGDIADAVRDRALTEAEIAEAVWQEDVLNHQGGTKAGQKLLDADQVATVPTTAEIADAIWDELAADHQVGGSMGERLNRVDQPLSQLETDIRGADGDSLKTLSDQIDGVATPADIPTTGQIASAVRDQALTESEIAEAVWEEDVNDHLGEPKTGQALIDASAVAIVPTTGDIAAAVRDQALTEDEIAEAVWNESIGDHLGGDKAGQRLIEASATAIVPTTGQIADAVWDELTGDHTTPGSFGDQTRSSGGGGIG